jgi:predicted O-methyltransferase YrrM
MPGRRKLWRRHNVMNTQLPQRRRDFLRTTGAAGVSALLAASCKVQHRADTSAGDSAASVPLDEVLLRLDAISREYVTIPKEEGQFLNLLVKLMRAKRVLELGTGCGYTTIWLALALAETGGQLTTVEIAPDRVEVAKKHLAEVGLATRVTFHQGDAHVLVSKLEGPFDIAYLDADKGGNVDYFNKLFPQKLPPGSLLIAHNAILLAEKVKPYLDLVRSQPAFDTLLIRAVEEDAFAVSYRRQGTA